MHTGAPVETTTGARVPAIPQGRRDMRAQELPVGILRGQFSRWHPAHHGFQQAVEGLRRVPRACGRLAEDYHA
jgi:hypothetical protein